MKNKRFLADAFILALLFSAVAGHLTIYVEANPYYWEGYLPARADTIPPEISMFSPSNNTIYNVNNITLAFNVTEPTGPTVSSPKINQIYYNADWLEKIVVIYDYVPNIYYSYSGRDADGRYSRLSIEKNLKGIPEGNHNITVVAWYEWLYVAGSKMNMFFMNCSFSVNFVVDTTHPQVSVLSAENKTYNTANVPLNFTVDESFSKVSYVLDGQENVTIAGNITLAGLSCGVHNVTVYAWDAAGNAGTSETVFFTITEPGQEPFSTATVAAVSGISGVVVVGAILAIYFKKRKH